MEGGRGVGGSGWEGLELPSGAVWCRFLGYARFEKARFDTLSGESTEELIEECGGALYSI